LLLFTCKRRIRKIAHLKEELASVIRLIEVLALCSCVFMRAFFLYNHLQVDRSNATLSLLSDDTKRAK
jgi:hypothetical protein